MTFTHELFKVGALNIQNLRSIDIDNTIDLRLGDAVYAQAAY